MHIEVYGKQTCGLCEAAKKKLAVKLAKWHLADKIEVRFMDLESWEGSTEGALNDVDLHKLPTTMVRDGSNILLRWNGQQPDSRQLFDLLKPLMTDPVAEAAD